MATINLTYARRLMYERTRESAVEHLLYVPRETLFSPDEHPGYIERSIITGKSDHVGPDIVTHMMTKMGMMEGSIHTHPGQKPDKPWLNGATFSINDIIAFIAETQWNMEWTEVITSDGYVDRLHILPSYDLRRIATLFPSPVELWDYFVFDLLGESRENFKNEAERTETPERRLNAVREAARVLHMGFGRTRLDI